jgi:hypothetical protein
VIAGLDSSTAGAIASDGGGWIKKTYTQFKTALALVEADVGLGNVDNTSDAAKPISTATQTALNAKEATANKGVANGYASLDANVLLPVAQLPVLVVNNRIAKLDVTVPRTRACTSPRTLRSAAER